MLINRLRSRWPTNVCRSTVARWKGPHKCYLEFYLVVTLTNTPFSPYLVHQTLHYILLRHGRTKCSRLCMQMTVVMYWKILSRLCKTYSNKSAQSCWPRLSSNDHVQILYSCHGYQLPWWSSNHVNQSWTKPRSQSTVRHIKPMAKVTMYLATLKTIQEWHSWYDWNTILETLNLCPWTSAIPKCHSYPGRQPYTMITHCPETRGFRTVCNHRQPLGEIQEQLAVSYSVVKQHILLSDMNDRSSNNNLKFSLP